MLIFVSSSSLPVIGNVLNQGGGGGTGDVSGPGSSTNNHFALFDGATGKIIKDSGSPLSLLTNKATGAASSAAGNIVLFADATGKLLANSSVLLSDVLAQLGFLSQYDDDFSTSFFSTSSTSGDSFFSRTYLDLPNGTYRVRCATLNNMSSTFRNAFQRLEVEANGLPPAQVGDNLAEEFKDSGADVRSPWYLSKPFVVSSNDPVTVNLIARVQNVNDDYEIYEHDYELWRVKP